MIRRPWICRWSAIVAIVLLGDGQVDAFASRAATSQRQVWREGRHSSTDVPLPAWGSTTNTRVQPSALYVRRDNRATRRRIALHLSTSSTSSIENEAAATDTSTTIADDPASSRRPCFYRSPAHKNTWQPRLELSELVAGQELQATVVQELLTGKTGPKLFCEVGVGRYNPRRAALEHDLPNSSIDDKRDTTPAENDVAISDDAPSQRNKPNYNDWQIVTAMLRLPDRKLSVARKRTARLRKKPYFPVYVSRIRTANGALEVSLTPEDAQMAHEHTVAKQQNQQALSPGKVVTGRVVRVEDYGVVVNLGAQRHGLLHISKVAALLGRFIDKAEGLQTKAGLKRGAVVQLQIAESDNKKEIALDFTTEAYQVAADEKAARQQRARPEADDAPSITTRSASTGLSKEEEEAWAAFATNPTASASHEVEEQVEDEYENDEDEDDDDDEDYDEDREIEDALGLGYY